MDAFNYHAPTKIVFGKNTENKVGQLVKKSGCKKVLVHYGGSSAKKSGLLDAFCFFNGGLHYIRRIGRCCS